MAEAAADRFSQRGLMPPQPKNEAKIAATAIRPNLFIRSLQSRLGTADHTDSTLRRQMGPSFPLSCVVSNQYSPSGSSGFPSVRETTSTRSRKRWAELKRTSDEKSRSYSASQRTAPKGANRRHPLPERRSLVTSSDLALFPLAVKRGNTYGPLDWPLPTATPRTISYPFAFLISSVSAGTT